MLINLQPKPFRLDMIVTSQRAGAGGDIDNYLKVIYKKKATEHRVYDISAYKIERLLRAGKE